MTSSLFTQQNMLIAYAVVYALANFIRLFLPKDHPTVAGTICDKVLSLGPDLHKLMGA